MNNPDKVILHCSDSPHAHHDNVDIIREWHLARGFNDIGYHYIILQNGTIHTGRKLNVNGAHCRGQNSKSIGICLTGRDVFTDDQFESCAKLINSLEVIYCKELEVKGHNEFSNKTCPNFNVKRFIKLYK